MAKKILVVEDDASIKRLVTFKLKNSGYEFFTTSNGIEALEFLKSNCVDLIITDIMMPLMSGKELIVALKQNSATKDIPTIVLTSKTLEKEVVEGLALGAADYIKKPFSPQELLARVKIVLERKNP